MILFKDYLPGNLAQVNFKKLLAQQENLLYLSRTTRRDLAQAPSLELTPNKFPQ